MKTTEELEVMVKAMSNNIDYLRNRVCTLQKTIDEFTSRKEKREMFKISREILANRGVL